MTAEVNPAADPGMSEFPARAAIRASGACLLDLVTDCVAVPGYDDSSSSDVVVAALLETPGPGGTRQVLTCPRRCEVSIYTNAAFGGVGPCVKYIKPGLSSPEIAKPTPRATSAEEDVPGSPPGKPRRKITNVFGNSTTSL